MADFKEIQIDGQVYQVKDETARQSSGGYAPPAGGIPKNDLSSDVQTSLGKAETSLQPSDKTQLQTAIDNVQAAIDAITSGDTTTAIKTFQEVINFLNGVTDDSTLVGKLNELRTLINAKYTKPNTGIPASDLASGVIPDVSGFATKTEVNTKANSSDVYTKSQTDAAIEEAVNGSVESVTVNGTKHTPDTNGDVNLGTIQGEKGEKGDTGNVEITDAGDMVALIVNDLTTGGAGNFLSAEMGKRLKQNVDAVQANIVKLYNKLANMAFWDAEDKTDAEPTPLDWSVPKVAVTITNNIGSNAVIKRNGTAVSGSLQVDMGDPLTLTIEAAEGYELADVAATVDGVAATPTEADGVYTLSVEHVNAAMAIAFNGSVVAGYQAAPKNDYIVSGSVVTYGMQQGNSVNANFGTVVPGMNNGNTQPGVILSPAGYPYDTKIFTTNHSNTNPGKGVNCYFATGGKRYLKVKLVLNEEELAAASNFDYKIAVACYTSSVINNSQADNNVNSLVDGWVVRVPYATGDVSTYEWKIDLHTYAADNGKQAGDIAYVKFLLSRSQAGTSNGTDSRLWFDKFTLKYVFIDD